MNSKQKKNLVIRTAVAIIVITAVAALKIAGAEIPAAVIAGTGTAALTGIFFYQKLRCNK
jgi:cation transport ATPase